MHQDYDAPGHVTQGASTAPQGAWEIPNLPGSATPQAQANQRGMQVPVPNSPPRSPVGPPCSFGPAYSPSTPAQSHMQRTPQVFPMSRGTPNKSPETLPQRLFRDALGTGRGRNRTRLRSAGSHSDKVQTWRTSNYRQCSWRTRDPDQRLPEPGRFAGVPRIRSFR